jgi:hypothetical protein
VIAGNVLNGTTRIQAKVGEADVGAVITLNIRNGNIGTSYGFKVVPSSTGIPALSVTAGEQFDIRVTILDSSGSPMPSFAAESAPRHFTIGIDSKKSWTGQETENVPLLTVDCTFATNSCDLGLSVKLKAAGTSRIWVGDGNAGLIDAVQDITVVAGSAAAVVLANGPTSAATPYASASTVVLSASLASQTYHAVSVDSAGNFLATNGSCIWTGTGSAAGLTSGASASATFNPGVNGSAGAGTLLLSCGTLPIASYSLYVNPDATAATRRLRLKADSTTPQLGEPIKLWLVVEDPESNPLSRHFDGTNAYTGTYPIEIRPGSMAADTTSFNAPNGVFYLGHPNFGSYEKRYNLNDPLLAISSYKITEGEGEPFYLVQNTGVATLPLGVTLTDGSITMTAAGRTPTGLTFTNGPGHHVNLWTDIGNPLVPTRICGNFTGGSNRFAPSGDVVCSGLNQNSGTPTTYYFVLEDRAGNFVSNVAVTSDSATGAWAGDYTLAPDSKSITINRTVSGSGTLLVTTASGIVTTFHGKTN